MNITRTIITSCFAFLWMSAAAGPFACGQVTESFTEPYETVKVSAPVAGTVHRIHTQLGSLVEKNSLLAELDHSVLIQSRRLAEAKSASMAEINAAQIEIDSEQKRLQKLQRLREAGNASENEIESSLAKLAAAQTRLDAATTKQTISRIEVDRIQAEINQRKISSPISGVVVKIEKSVGEFLALGNTSLITIVDTNRLRARFYVTTEEAAVLAEQPNVKIRFIDTDQLTTAKIEFLSPITSADSGTVEVHLVINNDNRELRAGVPVRLELP